MSDEATREDRFERMARLSRLRLSRRPKRQLACSGRARDVLDYLEPLIDRQGVTYPFPVMPGWMGTLYLPADGLTRQEGDRLIAFVDALVNEEPPE